jgi:hypothetical protein
VIYGGISETVLNMKKRVGRICSERAGLPVSYIPNAVVPKPRFLEEVQIPMQAMQLPGGSNISLR